MSKRRYVIVGASGFLASKFIDYIAARDLNYITVSSVKGKANYYLNLEEFKPEYCQFVRGDDTIIMFSAISSPDYCSHNFREAYSINVLGTIAFIQCVTDKGGRVLFLSSDTVFGDTDNANNEETIPIKPLGEYALMKLTVENYFRSNRKVKIARLSYVVSKDDKFFKYLHHCSVNDILAEVYHPLSRNVLHIFDALEGIIRVVQTWEDIDNYVINFCGDRPYSRLDLCKIYCAIFSKVSFRCIQPNVEFYYSRPEKIMIHSEIFENVLGRERLEISRGLELEKLNNNK